MQRLSPEILQQQLPIEVKLAHLAQFGQEQQCEIMNQAVAQMREHPENRTLLRLLTDSANNFDVTQLYTLQQLISMAKACDKESIFGLIANYLLQCKEKQVQQNQEQLQAIEKITSDTIIQLIP